MRLWHSSTDPTTARSGRKSLPQPAHQNHPTQTTPLNNRKKRHSPKDRQSQTGLKLKLNARMVAMRPAAKHTNPTCSAPRPADMIDFVLT